MYVHMQIWEKSHLLNKIHFCLKNKNQPLVQTSSYTNYFTLQNNAKKKKKKKPEPFIQSPEPRTCMLFLLRIKPKYSVGGPS